MRVRLALMLVGVLFAAAACGNPWEHSHCDDTEIKRVTSPNRKLSIGVYDRKCSMSAMSYAAVEEPQWFGGHDQTCILITLPFGYHAIDVVWKDNNHIELSSPEKLASPDFISSHPDRCDDIAVTYNFDFNSGPGEEAPDKETLDAISTAITNSQDCLAHKYGYYNVNDELRWLMQVKEHRKALNLLCENLRLGNCRLTRETYDMLSRAAKQMHTTNCVEDLKMQVKP